MEAKLKAGEVRVGMHVRYNQAPHELAPPERVWLRVLSALKGGDWVALVLGENLWDTPLVCHVPLDQEVVVKP